MPTLSWKDYRINLEDIAPYDTTVMYVSKGTSIAELVADTARWAKANANRGARDLLIYCHGNPGSLEICKEWISLKNVKKLEPLSPYFDAVRIHACLIAKGSVGRAFCSKMAQVMVAPVTGAVELQTNRGQSTPYGWIDDGRFEGKYYIHDTAGGRAGPFTNP